MNDRTHGQQFKAQFLKTSAPSSVEGIEKYLASGMIRGIGPVYAKRLLRAFGEKVFDVIEVAPERLREVNGIGEVRASRMSLPGPSRRWCARSWCFCTASHRHLENDIALTDRIDLRRNQADIGHLIGRLFDIRAWPERRRRRHTWDSCIPPNFARRRDR